MKEWRGSFRRAVDLLRPFARASFTSESGGATVTNGPTHADFESAREFVTKVDSRHGPDRMERLEYALQQIAGPTRCTGAMATDDEGKPLVPALAALMQACHARSCVRCVARAALHPELEDYLPPASSQPLAEAKLHCGCPTDGSPHTTTCPTVLGDIARREQRWKDPDWICPRCDARNFAIRSACRLCGFDPALVIEMESGAAEGFIAAVAPDSLARVLSEVEDRRKEQDAQWGGPKHDDDHRPSDWARYMRKFISRANKQYPRVKADWEIYESRLLDVAALAVAAIQSSRRKRNA